MDQIESVLPAPGTLVRYLETGTRWYFALVRSVRPEQIAIDLFWGERKKVPPERIQPFAEFMATRTKSLFMDRRQLCQLFFAEDLLRLRKDRLKKMQAVLRKHGYSFTPDQWSAPNTRIYISADRSVVGGAARPVDREFASLLPHWLDPQKMPPGSRDPLGLQGHAERIANKLLPGLTVTTTRIGYYGFLCWAIQLVNGREPLHGVARREMLNRLERALVLCEFVHHGTEDDSCRVVGQRSRTQVLTSGEGGRFSLPNRILKNQNTSGALRLYATSLAEMGFVDEAPELAVDGKLPWVLTDLGRSLAQAFARRVPDGFAEFAFGDNAKTRESIRLWGEDICMSKLRTLTSYRDAFLSGFLGGKSGSGGTRFSTVRRLFKRRLLTGVYSNTARGKRKDAVGEEDVDFTAEMDEPEGLSNWEVLIDFYEEKPSAENADFQEAAVYEFIGLGLSAIFHHVTCRLQDAAQLDMATLQEELAKDRSYGKTWQRPRREASRRARPVRELVDDLFEAEEDPARQAVLGAELLLAVARGASYEKVKGEVAGSPVHAIFAEYFQPDSDQPLSEDYAQILAALVERHVEVSQNKNKQCWCNCDGGKIIRDDLQSMNVAMHAMRFPQLYSLCADLGLQRSDLTHDD